MKKHHYFLVLFILVASCDSKIVDINTKHKVNNIFPEVKNVTEFKNTDFIPTLESSFSSKKNIIYGATIPFAWSKIRNEIGSPLSNFTSTELEKLNKTTSYVNVLEDDEFQTSIEVIGNEVSARANFSISLPFAEPLIKFEESLKFGASDVESFGFWGGCSFSKLNYFNNENDFSISLFPENNEHEIILILNQNLLGDLIDFNVYFEGYKKQKEQDLNIGNEDKVEIPIIEFNLEKNYRQFEGSEFQSSETKYKITEAYQRNAFILNEYGAKVESEAEIVSEGVAADFEEIEPKMMIFNKPFVVLIKRKDAENPYFGIYIANDELLKKKK